MGWNTFGETMWAGSHKADKTGVETTVAAERLGEGTKRAGVFAS